MFDTFLMVEQYGFLGGESGTRTLMILKNVLLLMPLLFPDASA